MKRLTPVIALLLLLAACGDDDGSPTAPPSSEGSTTQVTSTAPPVGDSSRPSTTGVSTVPTSAATTEPPPTTEAVTPLEDLDLEVTLVADGLAAPTFVTARPGGDTLFVLEQAGRILELRADGSTEVVLDLTERVRLGSETGLLGLAFHPTDPDRTFIHYSARNADGVLAEISPDGTEREILRVPQPATNHNGGMIAFGPDGYLYAAFGDGGGANDEFRQGQDPFTLLGTIIRIDVDGPAPYAIPPDNPFIEGERGAPEVWAYGLRNPWRFAFDGNQLFIGDVGQDVWEEIDVADHRSVGLNFGWPLREGFHCFEIDPCDEPGLIDPVYEYQHIEGNCSVTGGYVYRGSDIPALDGAYFFADYCSGMIQSFRIDAEGVFQVRNWSDTMGTVQWITSFGTDGRGELYITTEPGQVYKIVQA